MTIVRFTDVYTTNNIDIEQLIDHRRGVLMTNMNVALICLTRQTHSNGIIPPKLKLNESQHTCWFFAYYNVKIPIKEIVL